MAKTTVFQKLFIIFATAVFILSAALTASIPLSMPGKLVALDPSPDLNTGDTAWIIIASIAGFLLSPCLAILYANVYGKDSKKTLHLALLTSALITISWITLSFSLTYGEDANGQGFMGFPRSYYMFHDVGGNPVTSLASSIPLTIFAVFELSYALIPVTIIACSLSDRVNIPGFLFFILIWHVCIYSPAAHIVWSPNGYFSQFKIQDFAGGIVVHMLTGITVLVSHKYLDYWDAPNKSTTDVVVVSTDYKRVISSTVVVWLLYVVLTAGKSHNASPVAAQVVVNSLVATTSALTTWYLVDTYREQPFTVLSVFNAILLGLVSISSAAGFVTVGGAMVISIFTVLFVMSCVEVRFRVSKVSSVGLPLSVPLLHGVGGTIGFILTAVFSYDFINPLAFNGLTYGFATPLWQQVVCAAVVWVVISVAVILCLLLSTTFMSLSAGEEEEEDIELGRDVSGVNTAHSVGQKMRL